MKIIKKNEHSVMIKPFKARDKQRLAIGVLIYFDLNNPQGLLKEQDLWKDIPPALPQNMVLDEGMPKANGEFLVVGVVLCPARNQRTGGSRYAYAWPTPSNS